VFTKYIKKYAARNLAVDLGSTNTLVYLSDCGIVVAEPSIIALKKNESDLRRKVLAVGTVAKQMLGRVSDSLTVVRPIREGVIVNFDAAQLLLNSLLGDLNIRSPLIRPQLIACIPHGVTEVDRRALKTVAMSTGVRQVYIVEEPLAAAIGADLPVSEPIANFILDIGGGTSEIAVITLGGIVYSKSIRFGSDKLDDAILQYIKKKYNLLIGELTAEQIKIGLTRITPKSIDNLPTVSPNKSSKHRAVMEIRGRDLLQGTPKRILISNHDVLNALNESLTVFSDLIITALEKAPPELSSDISSRGLLLSGGGSLLRGLDEFLAEKIGIPVRVVNNPLTNVVRGAAVVLDNLKSYQHLLT
jgi:rod shape-determining protein MreB and related proteins